MAKLSIRIDFERGGQLGPGKARLLELVAETGSIRKAASAMKMSYRRAWLLLQALEKTFRTPLVTTATGGHAGGGARLTPLGARVAAQYRSIETAAAKVARTDLRSLQRVAAQPSPRKPKPRSS